MRLHGPAAGGSRAATTSGDEGPWTGRAPRSRPLDETGKVVAIYTRVSSEDQAAHGYSLAAQERRLRAYCGAQGWTIADAYVDDGFTGRDIRRPAYTSMMQARGRWDAVLVLKMDRIHRNARNFMAMMDDLRRWGKDFVSATESLDTGTATGRFVADMLQRIAQLESEQTGERVHMGMREKARQGGFCGMSAPFGYEVRPGRLVVNRREAGVVRRICAWKRAGRSLAWIADRLNRDGIPTKKGKRWTKRQVHRIVHSRILRGALHWEEVVTPGMHPAIVQWTPRRRRRRGARAS